ncbi:MAG: hypothetical protein JNK05_31920 [Myxococcales bacterium]|nr:hypothetical protein [Myxococcales bacterium]
MQSTESDIELEPGSAKKIKLGEGATKAVAIDGDQVKIPISIAGMPPAVTATIAWSDESGAPRTLVLSVTGATFNGAASLVAMDSTLAGEVVASATKAVAE